MQQIPRGDRRRCIVAPQGRLLIKADYSQIELRIAAKISGDRALFEAYQRGEDLHTLTARSVLRIQEVTKEDRQLAKALNFGLLYGMGAKGFCQYARSQYGLGLTKQEAKQYRDAFFQSYPGLAVWHNRIRSRATKETRTLTGRRRLLDRKTPDTHRLNTPVQGTGADGLKLALALLWERREQVPGAFPVLAVHDEIVIEANTDQAEAAAAWVKQAMLDGMGPLISPVPVEVEVQIARTWGGD
jgi:DNA polymerase-1